MPGKVPLNGSGYFKTSGPLSAEQMSPDGTPWASATAADAGAVYKGISHIRCISNGAGGHVLYEYNGGTDLAHLVPMFPPISGTGMSGISFVANAGQTSFTLPSIPAGLTSMFRNGIKIRKVFFNVPANMAVGTYSGDTLVAGDDIDFVY